MNEPWFEELYGQMLSETMFMEQYGPFVERYPKFKKQFYEENPVMPGQFFFKNAAKESTFQKFVDKHNLSVSLEAITTGTGTGAETGTVMPTGTGDQS